MFGNQNNQIQIEKVENGYVVTITLHQKEISPIDMINESMTAIERIQNKITGEDWKDKMSDQVNDILKVEPPKPVRQYVCVDWKSVLKIINSENF